MSVVSSISGLTLVYLIAFGLQVFVLLFLFAKRQIMRFAWASRKEPHAEIGRGAPKWFRRRVLLNIDLARRIREREPRLANNLKIFEGDKYLWPRLAATAAIQELDQRLAEEDCRLKRENSKDFYQFLKRLRDEAFPEFPDNTLIRTAYLYEWARYSAKPFTEVEYKELFYLLSQLKSLIRQHRAELSAIGSDSECSDLSKDSCRFRSSRGQQLLETRPLLMGAKGKQKKHTQARFMARNSPADKHGSETIV